MVRASGNNMDQMEALEQRESPQGHIYKALETLRRDHFKFIHCFAVITLDILYSLETR